MKKSRNEEQLPLENEPMLIYKQYVKCDSESFCLAVGHLRELK